MCSELILGIKSQTALECEQWVGHTWTPGPQGEVLGTGCWRTGTAQPGPDPASLTQEARSSTVQLAPGSAQLTAGGVTMNGLSWAAESVRGGKQNSCKALGLLVMRGLTGRSRVMPDVKDTYKIRKIAWVKLHAYHKAVHHRFSLGRPVCVGASKPGTLKVSVYPELPSHKAWPCHLSWPDIPNLQLFYSQPFEIWIQRLETRNFKAMCADKVKLVGCLASGSGCGAGWA